MSPEKTSHETPPQPAQPVNQDAETERQRREGIAARNLRYALAMAVVAIVAISAVVLIFARNNASLQVEVDYINAQVNFAATREFSISPFEITQTPASAFIATATAYAELREWEPVTETFDGVAMVLVPAGCFYMGSNVNANERPIHEQCFDMPFWIDKYEVSQEAMYQLALAVQDESLRGVYHDVAQATTETLEFVG